MNGYPIGSTSVSIASAFNLAAKQNQQQQNQSQSQSQSQHHYHQSNNNRSMRRQTRSRSKSILSEDSVKESHIVLQTNSNQNQKPLKPLKSNNHSINDSQSVQSIEDESDLSDSYDYQPENDIVKELEKQKLNQQKVLTNNNSNNNNHNNNKSKGQWLAEIVPNTSLSDISMNNTPPNNVLGKRSRRTSLRSRKDKDDDDNYEPRDDDSDIDHVLSDEGKDRSKKWPKSKLYFGTVIDGNNKRRKRSRRSKTGRSSNASDVTSEISQSPAPTDDHWNLPQGFEPQPSFDYDNYTNTNTNVDDNEPVSEAFEPQSPPSPPQPKNKITNMPPPELPSHIKNTNDTNVSSPPKPSRKLPSPKNSQHKIQQSQQQSFPKPVRMLLLIIYIPLAVIFRISKVLFNYKIPIITVTIIAIASIIIKMNNKSLTLPKLSIPNSFKSQPTEISVRDFQKLSKGTQNIESLVNSLNKDIQLLKSRVKYGEEAHVKMQSINNKLNELKNIQHDSRIDEIQLSKMIDKILPTKVIVRKDNTGEVQIDDKFWQALKSVFVTQNTIKNPNWDGFLIENQQKLREWIKEESSSNDNEEVVHKSEFMNMVDDRIKSSLSSQNAGKSWFKSSSGVSKNELNEVVSEVVNGALERFSADTIGKKDYALFTAGARVIPSLTTPTYSITPKTFTKRLLARVMGGSARAFGRPPVTALHPDINVGMCWSFKGSQGDIGVKLARTKTQVSSYTIDHVSPLLSSDRTSAPKTFELWGITEDKNESLKIKEINEEVFNEIDGRLPFNESPPASNAALLSVDKYDVDSEHHIQTFNVRDIVKELNFAVDEVVLRISENHGNDNHTCLCKYNRKKKSRNL